MKWKWLLVVAFVLLDFFLVNAIYGKMKGKPDTVAVSKETVMATITPAKNVEQSGQNKAGQGDTYAFRKANWGMPRQEVMKTENEKPAYDQDAILMYNVTVSGMDTSCAYLFTEEKLFRGVYTFNLKHTNENDFLADYDKIKATMTDKYGKPKQDEINWKNDRYKADAQKYGFAVSLGHVIYFATWETKDTNIILELTGDNYDIHLRSSYWSKKIKGTAQASGL